MKNWMLLAGLGVLGVTIWVLKPWRSRTADSPSGAPDKETAQEPWYAQVDNWVEEALKAIGASDRAAHDAGDSVRTAQGAAAEATRELRTGVGRKAGEVVEEIAGGAQTVFGWLGMS